MTRLEDIGTQTVMALMNCGISVRMPGPPCFSRLLSTCRGFTATTTGGIYGTPNLFCAK